MIIDNACIFGSASKESACNAGDLGSILGLGRSPGEEKDYPLQYSGLKNPMDCIVHVVTKSCTRLSDFQSINLIKEMNSYVAVIKNSVFLKEVIHVLYSINKILKDGILKKNARSTAQKLGTIQRFQTKSLLTTCCC